MIFAWMSSIIRFPDSMNIETVNGLKPATKFLIINNIEKGIINLTDGTLGDIKISERDNAFRELLNRTNKQDAAAIRLMSELFSELSEYFIITMELVRKINIYLEKYDELITQFKETSRSH
jgi:hypothetical protein